jgi:hypothetical protein
MTAAGGSGRPQAVSRSDPPAGRMTLTSTFALLAVLLAVAFALLPVDRQVVTYAWQPAAHGARVPLLLMERTPDEFALTFPCRLAEGGQRQLFVSSRSPEQVPALTVRGGAGRVVAEVPASAGEPGGPRLGADLGVPVAAGCAVTVRFDRGSGSLAVEAAADRAELVVPEGSFELTGLHWTGEAPDGVHAEVHTAASSIVRNSTPQKLALGAIALLALASLIPRLRSGPGWWQPAPGWWRLHRSEWAILAVAAVVALIDLPRTDDGRILVRARSLAGFDLRANVSEQMENQLVPQRWLYEWLLGTSVGWSSHIAVLRLVPVVLVVAAWMLLRRRVLPALAGGSPEAPMLAVAATTYAGFVVAWSATLRPEPLVVLLTVVVLAVTGNWPSQPRVWPSAVVVAAVGLAVATHVAGLAAAFAALPAAARALRDLRASPLPVLTGVAWGSAVSLVVLVAGANLSRTTSAASGFDEGSHGYGPLDVLRYHAMVSDGTAPMMLATGLGMVGFGVSLAVAVWLRRDGLWSPGSAVVLGAALSPLALLFTPSKWIWHLAILAPVAVVGWAVLARRPGRVPPVAVLALGGAVLGLVTAWAMGPVWSGRALHSDVRGATLRRVSPDGWAEWAPWLVGPGVRWWLWVLLLLAVVAGAAGAARLRGTRPTGGTPLAYGLLSCLVAVSIVQLGTPVADAVRSGAEWTFVRQSVVGLVSPEVACGVPAATPEVARHLAAAGPWPGGRDGGIATHYAARLFAPCHDSLRQAEGVWQVPELLMGQLPNDQQRVWLEYDMRPLGCNSFPRERAGDTLCFYELLAEGQPLAPVAVEWRRSR